MGILTGQTSAHAPQSVDANGSSRAVCVPSICGERMAPIGPEINQPYAKPPTFLYTGQTLAHAPQRIHLKTSRPTGSLRIFERPLSSSTRCNSFGPNSLSARRGPVMNCVYVE